MQGLLRGDFSLFSESLLSRFNDFDRLHAQNNRETRHVVLTAFGVIIAESKSKINRCDQGFKQMHR